MFRKTPTFTIFWQIACLFTDVILPWFKAKIANPHGSDVSRYLKKGAPKPEFRKSRAAEPTVDQIQVNLMPIPAVFLVMLAPPPKKKRNFNAFYPVVDAMFFFFPSHFFIFPQRPIHFILRLSLIDPYTKPDNEFIIF